MGVDKYILINGKRVIIDYDDEFDVKRGLVRIKGYNECFTSRRYGTFSPYTDMTYDTFVTIDGSNYTFHSDNVLQAEGIAILCAFASLRQLPSIVSASKDKQIGYAVNFGETREWWDKCPRFPF